MEHHILVGNHDAALRTPEINSTQVFSGLGTVVEKPMTLGAFAFMPWVEDPDELRAGVEKLAESQARFLFSHIMVEGAVPKAYGYPMDVLMPERWDRIILGDVHDPVSLLDGKVRYCGSPMQWHYGDAGGKRGFLILDTDTAEVEFIENTFSPRFHIIDDMTLASPRAYKAVEVAPRDFVQIRVTDPHAAAEVAQAVSKCVSVETMAVELEHDEPRIAVRSCDPHKAVLERYVEHIEEQEGMELGAAFVDVGLELLQEAKSL
jgi:DNA repair exonuclease SbcCD nuclease subunit